MNAGRTTNFVYEIVNFHGDADEINGIRGKSKIRDRLNALRNSSDGVIFREPASRAFAKNLRLVDSQFPKIISEFLLDFYYGNASSVRELSENFAKNNALGISKNETYVKMKTFLRCVALGMVPGKEWNGYLQSYGGYIVVKNDGELVCYYLYNDDKFRDYLFENTKFDTASSERHGFGKIYRADDKYFINLNLQIRFIK